LNSVYLSVIYLLLLLPLLFLVSIPSIYQGILGMIDNQKVKQAIVNVRPGSPLIGHQCPNEDGPWGRQFAFKIGDTLILCPKCATPHHLSCWEENQFYCMSRQCGVNYQIPASVMAKYNKNTTATRI
jgi:Zn ribbon nucleic-acid-binding protein